MSFFTAIDELLQVYYKYENSPKKCRQLKVVVEELEPAQSYPSCLPQEEPGLYVLVELGL